MNDIVTLILAGLSVGLGNFAASIAIGLSGVDRSVRLKMTAVFGVFETGMPIVGLLLGQGVAGKLGGKANLLGGGLLVLTGLYMCFEALRGVKDKEVKAGENSGLIKMLLAGLALSIDNLIIGFGLGTHHQSIVKPALIIGLTSILLALLGLEIGDRASAKLEEYSEIASGIILMLVGLAIGFHLLG